MGTPDSASSKVTVPEAASAACAPRKATHFSASPRTTRAGTGQLPARASISSARWRTAGTGTELADLLDQGMADIGAGRPAEALVSLRLERFQRQNVVHVGAHLSRPPG